MDPIISLEHVFKSLGQRGILKDVTLAVEQGDIFGYLGPNGAGKTTSIRILLGLFIADSGHVSILGKNPRTNEVRKHVGFVLETDGLYDDMSAHDNLAYYGQIYEVSRLDESINRAVNLVSLQDRVKDKVGTYSKGMRQRLSLARAILHDPEVLVLDEPTAGVDPTGQIEIRHIMLDLAHKQHKTILLSSHNLDEVQRICNRIALIHQGQIKLTGDLEKLQHQMSRNEVVIETTEPIGPSVQTGLSAMGDLKIQNQKGNIFVLSLAPGTNSSDVVNFLASTGVKIEQVKKQEATLEEIYTAILKEAEVK